METKNTEASVSPITHTESALGAFQTAAQKGFQTQEASLTSYKSLLSTVDGYLDKIKTPSEQDKELFKKMFEDHQKTYALPVEVFIKTRRKIQEASYQDYGLLKDSRFTDRVSIAHRMINAELHDVSLSLEWERQAVRELQELAHGEQAISTDKPEGNHRVLQRAAVEKLSQKPELQQDVIDKNAFSDTVESIINGSGLTPDEIKRALDPYGQYLTTAGTTVEEIYLRATHRQDDKVKQALQRSLDKVNAPEFLWGLWTQKGEIPSELTDNFEQVLTLMEIENIAQAIADFSPSKKAATLLPFLDKGIRSALLLEIAKGNYEFPENFALAQADALLHFFDTYEEINRPNKTKHTPLKFKLAAAVAAGTIIATPFVLDHFEKGGETLDPASVDLLLDAIPPEELSELDNRDLPGQNKTPETQDAVGAFNVNSFEGRPNNESPETFAEATKHIIWRLEGNNLGGYYRNEPSSLFNSQNHAWRTEYKYEPNSKVQFATTSEIKISGHLPSKGQYIPIPVKNGMAITNDSLRFTDLNNPKTILALGSVLQTTNGSYFIYLPDKATRPDSLQVSYSIGKAENVIKPPTPAELANMSEIMIARDQLPKDIKVMLDTLDSRKDLSTATKVKVLEKYVKETFLYSLNPRWSDFYHEAPSGSEFIKRIFEGKKADCDVSNTALVALLRAYGIPARMGGGFSNGSFLDNHSDALTGVEGHGWTEAYVNGVWLNLDGTPPQMDAYTQKAFELMGLGKTDGSPELGNLLLADNRSLDNMEGTHANDELAYFIEDSKGFAGGNPVETALLSLVILNTLSRLGANKIDKKNREHVRMLQGELKKRAWQYFENPQALVTLLNREMDTLSSQKTNSARGKTGYVIPPIGIVALTKTLIRHATLKEIPYSQPKETPPVASEPSALDFMVNFLGYDEKKIKGDFIDEAHRRTTTTLYKHQKENFYKDGKFMNFKSEQAIMVQIFEAFRNPGDIADLARLADSLAPILYPQYLEIAQRQAVKKRGEIKPFTEREFKELLTSTARIFLVRRQAYSSYEQAMEALKRKTIVHYYEDPDLRPAEKFTQP